MKPLLIAVLLCFVVGAPAYGRSLPEDFAYGLPLTPSGATPFAEVELPLAVYHTLTRADLGDLRVFNSAGEEVPHLLRGPEAVVTETPGAARAVPFFPLRAADDADEALAVRVAEAPGDWRVEIQTRSQAEPTTKVPVSGYLLDLGGLDFSVAQVELDWEDGGDFFGEVEVATSDQLKDWRPLTRVVLARLDYQGRRLEHRRIDLPTAPGRYLRLRWSGSAPLLEPARVVASARPSHATLPEIRQWLPVTATPLAETPGLSRVDLGGRLPVAALRVTFAEANNLARLRLSSGANPEGPGRHRAEALVYRLRFGERELVSAELPLTASRDRYWFLRSDDGLAGARLEFGWRPDRLCFLVRGTGPFLLAYGNANLNSPPTAGAELLHSAEIAGAGVPAPERLVPGDVVTLGGPERLLPRRSSPSWRTLTLWGVLGLGVVLVGVLAWRLQRQLREAPTDSSSSE
ncbi:DUF3999 domain-containing protein [Trichloromonas acetexigens]|uniref:DUF3999 domain-containing protein n=1 Tax=Trichloromonas acetexigens TaxID=38815 RepID=A0A550JET4_9BACT|nr:DUF3999 domain-containing protein [Desulfuromonas acetexigens]TRO81740.1 DUF3999 domain-containing protein [Desulfuromonas acetexigens]